MDEATVRVEHAVSGGYCLARLNGRVLLVAGALPGETVKVRVTKEHAHHAEAEVVEVVEAHRRRREPPCPYATDCGGCDYQHAERDLQLEMKRSIVVDAFRRIAKLEVDDRLDGPEATAEEFGTRNRLTLTSDPTGRLGLLRRASHEVVPIDDCMLMPPVFGDHVLPWVRGLPARARVHVRFDSRGETAVWLESRGAARKPPKIERPDWVRGIVADDRLVSGERDLLFRIGGKELTADATSFFQVSLAAAGRLVEVVSDCIGERREGQLLDLYAGVGLFAVCAGEGFDRVIAAESDAEAVRHLKANLNRHGVRGRARAETAEKTLQTAPLGEPETVIVDPPRKGLSKAARQELITRQPQRVVSVSCDPPTAARDARALLDSGWRLTRLVAVDLFPVTAHVETVALLERD